MYVKLFTDAVHSFCVGLYQLSDLFVIKRVNTQSSRNLFFNYFVSYLQTDLRNNSLSSVSSVIRQRREVRTWTWAAAEKSRLSTAAELGRVALLFLKASAMTG